jgi:phosphate:Na+ symporter
MILKFKLFIITILTMFAFAQAQSDAVSISKSTPQFGEKTFINMGSKELPGAAELHWSIDYGDYSHITNLIIKYRRKIDKKKKWHYSPVLPASMTKYELFDLREADKYEWYIGCRENGGDIKDILKDIQLDESQMSWSKKSKFETDRFWGLYKFLVLLGSLGLFIYGMKLMSEGLQQSAGNKLRQILSRMTSNRVLGVMSGFLITALVQSSSATTVMTVSFVNAGLLTLVESAGVMMGANIGTTITGWLVSLFGFKISVSSYSLLILAVGAPMMFISKGKSKGWANALIGFAILFMGLGFLKDAVPNLGADSPIIEFFTQFKDNPFFGRIMFVLLGTLVTIVVQSSSAAMALTLTLVLKGIIPFDVGAAMILGENIGTTITAELASLVGNVHAKRSARIHSMFNVIGVIWMIFMMPFFLKIISSWMGSDPFTNGGTATLALAAFHTVFNLSNVLLQIAFVPWLVKIAIITVPSKGEEDEVFKLEYISSGLTHTPELSILEARKEVNKFGEIILKMSTRTKELLNNKESKEKTRLIDKLAKYEEITDRMEEEIASYLSKISVDDLSKETSVNLRSMLSIINDLERIGDIYFEISKTIERKDRDKIWFHQKQRDQLNGLFDLVDQGIHIMLFNLGADQENVSQIKAELKESEINQLRNKLRKSHLKSIETKEYNIMAGMVYSNLFASLERVGDHVINVTEALVETD